MLKQLLCLVRKILVAALTMIRCRMSNLHQTSISC